MPKKISVIGSGVAGLASAALMAKAGHSVQLFEKNEQIGGRARQFEREGFVFDMGPSWYWMPEVFEKFYHLFGHQGSDFYDLKRLDPSYRIFWKNDQPDDIPSTMAELEAWFEKLEPGSSKALKVFLKEAKYKYEVGMNDLVYKPGLSLFEFMDRRVIGGLFNLHLTKSFSAYIKTYFKHPKIISLLEFPILFLGAMPSETPALYSLMNYADLVLGTWYPMGGMHKIIDAFTQIAREQGVQMHTLAEVSGFEYQQQKIKGIDTAQGKFETDWVISGADYHHTDQKLAKGKSNYTEKYWDKRQMAPSCLLFYVGVKGKVEGLKHHNLFFDEAFEPHALQIYKNPTWPDAPLFYVCCPSKTDSSVAPDGDENLFMLIPLAPDLKDDPEKHQYYFDLMVSRMEQQTGQNFKSRIQFHQSYCLNDFKKDYHAYKGNAYGLANTLRQTAILKPSIRNKHIQNLYYTGQLTVPGPGLPPAIISGQLVANEILKKMRNH